jgi:hypothetical protein
MLVSEATKQAALRFFLRQINAAQPACAVQPTVMTGQLALDSSALLRPSGAAKPLLAGAILTGDVISTLSLQNLAYLSYASNFLDLPAALASKACLYSLAPIAHVMPTRIAVLALNGAPHYSFSHEPMGLILAASSCSLGFMRYASKLLVVSTSGFLPYVEGALSPLSLAEFTLGVVKPRLPLITFAVEGPKQAVHTFTFSVLAKFNANASQPSFQPD